MSNERDDYNKTGMIFFLLGMGLSLVFMAYISFLHPGVSLDTLKDAREKADQEMAKAQTEPTEPWISTAEMVAQGKQLYAAQCAMCHGESGLGDGAAGVALNPKPRNLVEGEWAAGGSSLELLTTLTNGLGGTAMAAYGHLPESDRWALVHFIQSITKNVVEQDAGKLEAYIQSRKK